MTRPDVVISIHVNLQLHHELDPSRCLREQKRLMVDHPGIYVSGSKVVHLTRKKEAGTAGLDSAIAVSSSDPRGLAWRLTPPCTGPGAERPRRRTPPPRGALLAGPGGGLQRRRQGWRRTPAPGGARSGAEGMDPLMERIRLLPSW